MRLPYSSAAALIFLGAAFAQTGSAPDVWEPIRFLAGSWEGTVTGQPGTGTTTREYRFALNGKFLEARNKTVYPAQAKNPKGEVHEDWGMISFDRARKQFVLRQFHVEGFVNQYVSGSIRDQVLTFTSESLENVPAGSRARETYTLNGPNSFVERFEIADPGKDFEVYCETHFKRKR